MTSEYTNSSNMTLSPFNQHFTNLTDRVSFLPTTTLPASNSPARISLDSTSESWSDRLFREDLTSIDYLFQDNATSSSSPDGNNSTRRFPGRGDLRLELQIPIYAVIFLLSVVGNALVIVTVAQNKKMRSVTNVFLLNLSVSDLLLAVFCMPFTLVPIFLQNFIFGEVMCILIRYMQGVSVAVSVFTLVAISLERYFAICHPLKSRQWQTLCHSYKAIALCWVAACLLMIPLAVYHDLIEIGPSQQICRENWPTDAGVKAYTVLINLLLLVFPLLIMSWAYGCVCYTLWIGIKLEKQSEKDRHKKVNTAEYDTQNGVSLYMGKKIFLTGSSEDTESQTSSSVGPGAPMSLKPLPGSTSAPTTVTRPFRRMEAHRAMRQSNTERSQAAKKRVIKMLFIIVLEFFLFWSPIYALSTWMIFDMSSARIHVTSTTKSLLHLISYFSACSNPITYCFMNRNFRQSFLLAFRCAKKRYVHVHKTQMSFTSGNTMSTRAPPTPSMTTSYDKILDSDDISENSF